MELVMDGKSFEKCFKVVVLVWVCIFILLMEYVILELLLFDGLF